MKILFLIYSLGGGGAERVTSILANRMASRGHDVEIGVFDGLVPPHYPLSSAVKLMDLGLSGEPSSKLDATLLLAKRTRKVRRWLKDTNADLAIGMMTAAAVLLALGRTGLSLTVVGAERVYPAAFPLPTAWDFLRRFSYRLLDVVVAQTEATRQWLREHTTASRIEVIGNPIEGMPVADAEPVPPEYVVSQGITIVAAGRLVAQKGFDRLIDAFARIGVGAKDARLIILGDGPLRESLLKQTSALGITERVHLPGNVGNLGSWFEKADIFVLSSHFEGMPNALLEAMGRGLACAAYDIPSGTREFLKDGINGLLVDPSAPDGLASTLARLIDDAPLRETLGRTAAAYVAEHFSPEHIVDQWLALVPSRRRGTAA